MCHPLRSLPLKRLLEEEQELMLIAVIKRSENEAIIDFKVLLFWFRRLR